MPGPFSMGSISMRIEPQVEEVDSCSGLYASDPVTVSNGVRLHVGTAPCRIRLLVAKGDGKVHTAFQIRFVYLVFVVEH